MNLRQFLPGIVRPDESCVEHNLTLRRFGDQFGSER